MDALIPIYMDYDPGEVDALNGHLEIGEFILGLSLLEFIVGEAAISNRIDPEQAFIVQEELLLKYAQKQQSIEKFGSLGLSTGVWALCRLVDEAKVSGSCEVGFVENGFPLEYGKLDLIVRQVKEIDNN